MTEIGLGAAMNDRLIIINDLNNEIARLEIDVMNVMWRQDMGYEELRLFMFNKQYLEIEIEKRKMQLKIENIKIEIVKLDELRIKTNVNEVSVEDKKKMRLLGYNINNKDHWKLLSETMPLVEEKMKEIGFMNNYHHPDPDHDLKLMNTELKSNIEKLNLLKPDIYKMESWIYNMKMTKMKIKDITKPDVECGRQVFHFNDEESSDNELKTYKYNKEKIHSFWVKSSSINFAKATQVLEEKKQMKANGLDFAKKTGLRTIMHYWHLPLKEPKQLRRGVYWKKLELPEKGGFWGWDKVEKFPLTLQIYWLKLTCCSDDDQEDYSVDVSGEISLLIGNGIAEPEPSVIHVNCQTLTKKDPYLLFSDPTYIPFLFPSCPPPMIHAKLALRGRDEPDKLTRSMEVVDEVYVSGKEFSEGTSALSEDVNLGTGKHYRLKLTHGIVVNSIVANISVHVHPSLLDSWDGKCKITASGKYKTCRPAVLANYKKVSVTIDNGCLQLLRPRICVDFFGFLGFYMKCFGSSACLDFIPRDCYSHDNCERKEALKGIIVQVKWSTR